MGVGAAVAPSLGDEPNGIGLSHPFFDAELVVIQPRLTFNYGESAIVEIRVVYLFPNAQKFHRVAVA